MINCNCKSAPKYHKNDCIMYHTDGSIKNKFELERELNTQMENEVNDILPVYFKLIPNKNLFIIETICKAQGTKIKCPDFLKIVLNKVCSRYNSLRVSMILP